MIKIFSTDKVRTLDQYTIQNEPISSNDLVERAATTFTSEFCRRYSKQNRIIVFAGQGNNGAYALAIARLLTESCLMKPRCALRPRRKQKKMSPL